MATALANAVSCSVVSRSSSLGRCRISNSCSCVCSSSVRLPRQHSFKGEARKGRQQCCAVLNSKRASREVDIPVHLSSADGGCGAEAGIRCYRSANGEITCEGFDEGPHFHPVARAQQRTVMRNAKCVSLLTKGVTSPSAIANSDSSLFGFVEVEVRGECYYEGKDES